MYEEETKDEIDPKVAKLLYLKSVQAFLNWKVYKW